MGNVKNGLMGYSTFKSSPKNLIQSADIGNGQIKAEHLDPGLFSEIKSIGNHNHSGTKSRRIKLQDLEGVFPATGFYIVGTNGTRYQITVVAGVLTVTAA